MTTTVLTIAIILVTILAFQGVRTWLEMRGTRLVTCPETRAPSAVEVDVRYLVAANLTGLRDVHLRDCSRWPERRKCGQLCLSQIEEGPRDCLVRGVLGRWFAEKSCALCGRRIAPGRGQDDEPAFKAADDRVWEWNEIRAEALPRFLESARAVCSNCMIAEGFRNDRRKLVVERRRSPRHAPRP